MYHTTDDSQLMAHINNVLESFVPEDDIPAPTFVSKVGEVREALCPIFKTDDVGKLILRFDVLRAALQDRDQPELRKELSSHINKMMTEAVRLLTTDSGLYQKNLIRLEAAGVTVSLCAVSTKERHYLLVLNSKGVSFSRKIHLTKFTHTS